MHFFDFESRPVDMLTVLFRCRLLLEKENALDVHTKAAR